MPERRMLEGGGYEEQEEVLQEAAKDPTIGPLGPREGFVTPGHAVVRKKEVQVEQPVTIEGGVEVPADVEVVQEAPQEEVQPVVSVSSPEQPVEVPVERVVMPEKEKTETTHTKESPVRDLREEVAEIVRLLPKEVHWSGEPDDIAIVRANGEEIKFRDADEIGLRVIDRQDSTQYKRGKLSEEDWEALRENRAHDWRRYLQGQLVLVGAPEHAAVTADARLSDIPSAELEAIYLAVNRSYSDAMKLVLATSDRPEIGTDDQLQEAVASVEILHWSRRGFSAEQAEQIEPLMRNPFFADAVLLRWMPQLYRSRNAFIFDVQRGYFRPNLRMESGILDSVPVCDTLEELQRIMAECATAQNDTPEKPNAVFQRAYHDFLMRLASLLHEAGKESCLCILDLSNVRGDYSIEAGRLSFERFPILARLLLDGERRDEWPDYSDGFAFAHRVWKAYDALPPRKNIAVPVPSLAGHDAVSSPQTSEGFFARLMRRMRGGQE